MTNEMRTKKWPNTNHLKSIRCPKCGSYEPFFIAFKATYLVYDNGIPPGQNGHAWGMDSDIKCTTCGHTGIVGEFQQNRTVGEITRLKGKEGKGRTSEPEFVDWLRELDLKDWDAAIADLCAKQHEALLDGGWHCPAQDCDKPRCVALRAAKKLQEKYQ